MDRHYLSEFLRIVFFLGTWLASVRSGPKYEMAVGENGSGIGGKGGEGIRMLAGRWSLAELLCKALYPVRSGSGNRA
ncbi:hypothetical protein C2L65_21540 [Paraburkholderia terrae]|uniref:Uncharacterized protein n=1 Tax=Paraburkholderia terrae TaxID=311230 RepID=A0A2I8ERK8_9BURK|nr:hypothetical protein C2L65_21540 [Paraburkholderia terrae]